MASVKKKTSSAVPHIERPLIEKNVQKSQLANALGVTNPIVRAILKGTRGLLAKDVPGLVKALGQDNDYWFRFIEKDNDDNADEETLCVKFKDANGNDVSLFHPKIEDSDDAEAKALYMARLIGLLNDGGFTPEA